MGAHPAAKNETDDPVFHVESVSMTPPMVEVDRPTLNEAVCAGPASSVAMPFRRSDYTQDHAISGYPPFAGSRSAGSFHSRMPPAVCLYGLPETIYIKDILVFYNSNIQYWHHILPER
jgi:hypothetical protein